MRSAAPTTEEHRLLGRPADLAGHRHELGPLPIASGADWRQWFAGIVEESGLTGRGGAAFPTAIKLAAAGPGASTGTGVMVVNGMEGEPASDKDKVLLTRVPHLVLDGAQLLAAACGARHVVVCVPAGRDGVAARVQHAMDERATADYAPRPETVARPPDRFVAGEESALVQWIASGRSLPSFRTDKGVPLRIGKRPALVHNAETLAHIALIARFGPAAFRCRGMSEEPGTTLVTVSGAVAHPGVVEVDRGTPLLDIVARAAPTGPPGALLVGGYGGTWVGRQHFGTPYASIPLRTIGASAGVGVVVALGTTACGVAETARLVHYMALQSSGQCGPCVLGLPAIADDLIGLLQGRPDPELMSRLHRRLREVDGRGACRHPDGVISMVRSGLEVFAADVESHALGRPCAHVHQPTLLRFPPSAGPTW